jgi:G protein-coupled receptor 158
MVELNLVISCLLTIILFTLFSVAFAASLREPDEQYYNIRASVLNQRADQSVRTIIRHGRSRSFFSHLNRRTDSEAKYLDIIPFGSYDIANSNENKNSIMESSLIDHDRAVTSKYESSTVVDMLEELGLTSSSSDNKVAIKPATIDATVQGRSETATASLQATTSRMQSELLQTTASHHQVQYSEPSVNKFPDMFMPHVNSSDSGRNFDNKLRSTADLTSPRRRAHFDGQGSHSDESAVPNPKDDSESLSYDDEGFDFAVEATETDAGAGGAGRISESVDARRGSSDVVTRFLTIVESQHLLGENCTAGTDLNLGEGVVDRYAQERFRVEADVAVNRANMLTRLWKYADPEVVGSEYLLHASVLSMVEFDEDIFAAGNCYDQFQYKDYVLFCPYAYRLPEGPILVKDLAVEYKYLSNTSEWFYIARKHAENVIRNYSQFSHGESRFSLTHESVHDCLKLQLASCVPGLH